MPRRQPLLPFFDRVPPRLRELYRRRLGEAVRPDASDEPVARHFWGRRWQEHLEACLAGRLPGGRACVREGAINNLEVRPGHVQAIVVGATIDYVDVRIRKLRADVWKALRIACLGQIGSRSDLLDGRVSGHVRDVLTDPDRGLFPTPADITPRCPCGDRAAACKHAMAALYGAGGSFDRDPLLLFRLRGVQPADLISDLAPPVGGTWRRDVLAEDALAEIFGIHLDAGPKETALSYRRRLPVAGPRPRKTPAGNREPGNDASAEEPAPARRGNTAAAIREPGRAAAAGEPGRGPGAEGPAPAPDRSASAWRPTGPLVARLRERTGFTVAELAELLHVSPSTVRRWEITPGPLRLLPPQREALRVLRDETGLAE